MRDVLRPAVRVDHETAIALRLPCVQGLLKSIEDEVRRHRTADTPTHDAPGVDVDDEGHVLPALPGRDVREVRDPELVRSLGLELPVDLVQRARRLAIADRRSHDLASHDAAQSEAFHQSFDRAPGRRRPLTSQLPPDLLGAVDLHVCCQTRSI